MVPEIAEARIAVTRRVNLWAQCGRVNMVTAVRSDGFELQLYTYFVGAALIHFGEPAVSIGGVAYDPPYRKSCGETAI